MKKFKIWLLVGVLGMPYLLTAQKTSGTFYISPLHVFDQTFKIDYEHGINRQHLFQLGVGYKYINQDENFHNYNRRGEGVSFHGMYKYCIRPEKDTVDLFYVGIGPVFKYFKDSQDAYAWAPVMVNNINAYQYGLHRVHTTSLQYGFDVILGIKAWVFSNVYADLYGGIGIRKVHNSYSLDNFEKNDRSIFYTHPTYQGVVPLIGLRVGMMLY